ncbi:stalk domain-containing protein [Paenibacillus sacheonensis]|uniref:Copper amine oxidase-like N-terminal domain-containing protein n=1 Tax=Paenibacillus sacheonensis TaxID=742054 RepID=A0A7X5C258_9BACL|nr:stalk domain-containing protein [Paenibacillus sacheonensis]MBM7567140.1 hypothetical protein [Paenibacillus sacheonensis]NBC70935.1 hypothetical protein [Paenibacillus sacheonensis]
MSPYLGSSLSRAIAYGIGGMLLLGALGLPAVEAAPSSSVQTVKPAQSDAEIAVVLDRQPLKLSAPPILVQGNLMFPAKAIFDAVGTALRIQTGHVYAGSGPAQIEGKLGSKYAVKGKQTIPMPAPPTLQNGRLYVPAKFVSLVLDKSIAYGTAGGKKTATIGYTEDQMHGFARLLFEAARNGDAAVIEKMLSRGVDVNVMLVKEYLQNTALDYAVLNDHAKAAKVLLEHGGTFDKQRTFQVLMSHNAQLMEELLKHGVDPNMQMPNFNSSLLAVACNSIHSMNPDGTAAIIHPSPQLVKLLLDYGGDPTNDDSLTNAIQANSREIVQLLVRHGADPYREDSLGSTPYERAVMSGATSFFILDPDSGTAGNNLVPMLSVQYGDGKPVSEGTITMVGTGSQGSIDKSFFWQSEVVNLDVPDGEYRIPNIRRPGAVYLFPDKRLQVDRGTAFPLSIRLPELNVSVTIANAGKNQTYGVAFLYNADGTNVLTAVEVVNGKIGMYLPPGTYRLTEYSAGDTVYKLSGDTVIAVTENGGRQDLAVTMS